MNQQEYTDRIHEYLMSMDAISDPGFNVDQYNEKVRKSINESKYILDKEPIKKAVLVQSHQAPRLYGLPKLHKKRAPYASCRFVRPPPPLQIS